MSGYRSRLATGSLWLGLGRAATNLLSFLSIIILARLLLPEDFGLIAIATTILVILNAVTNMPLGSALVQHSEPTRDHLDTVWTFGILRGVAVAALLAAAALPIAELYSEDRLALVLVVLGAAPILDGLKNPRSILLTRSLIFWQQVLLQILDKLAMVIVSIVVALTYETYWALVVGVIAGKFVSTVASYFVLPFRPRPGFRHGRELFNFSYWLTLGQVVSELNWRFDQLLIGWYIGRTALGYYRVGNDIAQTPTRETTAPLLGTLFPAFARLAHDRQRLASAYCDAQAMVTMIALPAGVGAALIAEPLILMTMTEKWLPAVFVVQTLAPVFAIQTIGSLASPLAMGAGQTRSLFIRDLQVFAMRIPIIIGGMFLAGLPGVVYGRVISGLLGIPVNMLVVRDIADLRVRDQIFHSWRSLVSVTVMAIFVYGLDRLLLATTAAGPLSRILLAIGIGAIVYPASHLLCWVMAGRPAGPESETLGVIRRYPRLERWLPALFRLPR